MSLYYFKSEVLGEKVLFAIDGDSNKLLIDADFIAKLIGLKSGIDFLSMDITLEGLQATKKNTGIFPLTTDKEKGKNMLHSTVNISANL